MELGPMAAEVFRCPGCGSNLVEDDAGLGCRSCGFVPDTEGEVIDFVRDGGGERAHYDDFYRRAPRPPPPRDINALASTWVDPDAPWEMRRVWERLGDLEGRNVVLLGNGESFRELYLLAKRPKLLVWSDLSPVGLRQLRQGLGGAAPANLTFAAIDAYDLPLADESVDLVYGFAFTHHLPVLEPFLAEVFRVLRPGGRCVFMDSAYSPAWQRLKLTVFSPLMKLSHRRRPRSPEDVRDTLEGGYREESLGRLIRDAGGEPWFERLGFVYYMWHRLTMSILPNSFRRMPGRVRIARAAIGIDRILQRFDWARRNMIRLIWGFEKRTG